MHGALFVTFVVLTLRAMRERGKPFAWGALLAVASLIPFATFALDRGLREDDESWRNQRG